MRFIAKGHGKVPPDPIRTKANIITKTGYKNTQKESLKVFYSY